VKVLEKCYWQQPQAAAMDIVTDEAVRFEGFTLDLTRRVLRKHDCEVELRPKSFDVLCCLVANAGRIVTKDSIIETVWPNVVATDESLARCVSDVRLALGDRAQRIIKTVPGRGYLFAAPVSRAASHQAVTDLAPRNDANHSPADQGAVQEQSRSRSAAWLRRWPVVAGVGTLMAVLGAGGLLLSQPNRGPEQPSIAVLPFGTIDTDPQQGYFADGITDDLTTSLSRFANLSVIARDSAFKYKGQHIDAKQVGRELGARYLLEGSLRREAPRLRVTSILVDATTGREVWAMQYDRPPGDVFAIQDEITQQIVVTLVGQVNKLELDRASHKAPKFLAAYDNYLRANDLMKNVQADRRGETLAAARALYEHASSADPRYAPAVEGLATTYLAAWLEPAKDHPIGREFQQQATLDRALLLAQEAVSLDGTFAEAHATLGWTLFWQRHTKEGLAEFDRAFELNPNLIDWRYGIMLSHGGRAQDAIEYTKRIMRLDPFHSSNYIYLLGKANFFVGRYDEAIELIRSASALKPSSRPPRVLLAAVAGLTGRQEEAHTAAAEVLRIQPDFTIAGWLDFLRLSRSEDAERVADGLRKAGLPE
jgi:TolB-like protein/DNA-binding winged helix-turn-helix (wHTH) protein/tetratricopeptide (TPR) repeat protein